MNISMIDIVLFERDEMFPGFDIKKRTLSTYYNLIKRGSWRGVYARLFTASGACRLVKYIAEEENQAIFFSAVSAEGILQF